MSTFLSVFAVIFVAELPDKTAFATLLLATRNPPWAVFLGAALAFVVQSAVAIAFGKALSLLPRPVVEAGAGVLFLIFAYVMWKKKPGNDEPGTKSEEGGVSFGRAFSSSFMMIFIAEWGDLTQLATAALAAARQAPFMVFCAATAALWCVTGIAVAAGRLTKHVIHPAKLQRVAAVAFLIVGIVFLAKGAQRIAG